MRIFSATLLAIGLFFAGSAHSDIMDSNQRLIPGVYKIGPRSYLSSDAIEILNNDRFQMTFTMRDDLGDRRTYFLRGKIVSSAVPDYEPVSNRFLLEADEVYRVHEIRTGLFRTVYRRVFEHLKQNRDLLEGYNLSLEVGQESSLGGRNTRQFAAYNFTRGRSFHFYGSPEGTIQLSGYRRVNDNQFEFLNEELKINFAQGSCELALALGNDALPY